MFTVWYDDQVWANYFRLSSPEQAAIIYHKLTTDGANEKCAGVTTCIPEGVPTIWNNRTRSGRDAETWFGRNGAGENTSCEVCYSFRN